MRNSAFVAAAVMAAFGGAASADPTGFQYVSKSRTVSWFIDYLMQPGDVYGSDSTTNFAPWSVNYAEADQTSTFGAGHIAFYGYADSCSLGWPNSCGSSSQLATKFTLTQPVSYTISGTMDGAVGASGVRLKGPDGSYIHNIGNPAFGPSTFSVSGVLQPGTYDYYSSVSGWDFNGWGQLTSDFRLDLPVNSCPADVSPAGGDGIVGVDDLFAVINGWGPCANPGDCAADIMPLGGNGAADVDDLFVVINAWGDCPSGK